MSDNTHQGCQDCSKFVYDMDIKLVDELNQPLAGIPYRVLLDSDKSVELAQGTTDDSGELQLKNLPAKVIRLLLDSTALLDVAQQPHRLLRPSRDPADSQVLPLAEQDGREYSYCKVGQLIAELPSLQGWPEAVPLPPYHFPNPTPKGWRIMPKGKAFRQRRITLEVCPFRAWILALHHGPQYSLVNAYNLALMSILAYADWERDGHGSDVGSIKYFFEQALLDLSQLPFKVNDKYFTPLVMDVPFSQRYNEYGFIDTASDDYENIGDTQLLYALSQTEALIAWRGTADLPADAWTDAKALQTSAAPLLPQGKMHLGFKQSYSEMGQHKELKRLFDTLESKVKDKKLYLCGHSLGGALALIDSAVKQQYSPLLYTYGMPRVFDRQAQSNVKVSHFRHVNENDLVTTIPLPAWSSWKIVLAGMWGSTLLPASEGDYQHHGSIVHFTTTKALGFEGDYAQQGWMAPGGRIETREYKLILAPDAIGASCEKAFDLICRQYTRQQLDNPATMGANPLAHPSAQYADYLLPRLRSKLLWVLGQQSDSDPLRQAFIDFAAQSNQPTNRVALALGRADSDLLNQPMLLDSNDKAISAALMRFVEASAQKRKKVILQELVTLKADTQLKTESYYQHRVAEYNREVFTYSSGPRPIRPSAEEYKQFKELGGLIKQQRSGIKAITEYLHEA